MKLSLLLLVGLGGAAGSMLRYTVSHIFTAHLSRVPAIAATFTVNLLGCLLIGMLFGLTERYGWLTPQMRVLLMSGFCGGFTTFSAFALENVAMFQSGNYTAAISYTLASVVFCTAAVFAGIALAKAC